MQLVKRIPTKAQFLTFFNLIFANSRGATFFIFLFQKIDFVTVRIT